MSLLKPDEDRGKTESEYSRQLWEWVLGPPPTTNPRDSGGRELSSGVWHVGGGQWTVGVAPR